MSNLQLHELRSLFEKCGDAVLFFYGTIIVDANESALDLFEANDLGDMRGRDIFDFTRDMEKSRERATERSKGIPGFYRSHVEVNGKRKDVEVTSIPLNAQGVTSVSIVRDVTERVRLEQKCKLVFEQFSDLVVVTNESGVVFINPKGLEYLGLRSEDEIIGNPAVNLVHPDYRELATRYAFERRRGGIPPSRYRVKLLRSDGKILDVEFNASRIMWEGVPSSLVIVRDIGSQVELEESLRGSEARYRNLIENSPNAISVTIGNIIVYMNQKRLELTGHSSKEELLGTSGLDNLLPEDKLRTAERIERRMMGEVVGDKVNITMTRVDGSDIHVQDHTSSIVWEGKPAVMHILVDESDRVKYEDHLVALHKSSTRLALASTMEEVYDITIAILGDDLKYSWVGIGVVGDDCIDYIRYTGGQLEESLIHLDGHSVTARVVETGLRQFVRDTRLDEDYVVLKGHTSSLLSELAVPVIVNNRVAFILNVESDRLNDFDESDIILLELLASHMSSAVQNIISLEKNRVYDERLRALNYFGSEIVKLQTVEEVAGFTMDSVRSIFRYGTGAFGLVKNEGIYFTELLGDTITPRIPLSQRSITTRAVNTGATQLVPDVLQDPDYLNERVEDEVTLSELDVPVMIAGKAVALINLENSQKNGFSEADADLVEIMAEHVAAGLQGIQAAEARRRFEERLEALHSHAIKLAVVGDFESVVESTLDTLEAIIGSHYVSYMQRSEDKLQTVASRGYESLRRGFRLDGKGITVKAARERRSVLVNDLRDSPDYVPGGFPTLSELAVPVLVGGETHAVLNVESRKLSAYTGEDVLLLETFANHVGSALERIRNQKEAREAERIAIVERERAEQVRRLDEMKTSFIHTATHEIRTPITSIKGYTELAESKMDGSSPELARYLEVIKRNTERLERLTMDLLEVQRIESGQRTLRSRSVDLMELVRGVVTELEPLLQRRNQRLLVSGDSPVAEVDETRLTQVMINLVSNASKFSPEGSEILVNVVDGDEEIVVSVSDRGAGIDDADLPKLFKPFPGITVKGVKDSTGLGLSICKGLIELHGGRIWAESEGLGEGATFYFTLPKKAR